MRPVRAIILGYGIRGRAYASYADAFPCDFQVAGLADPVAEMPQGAGYPVWKDWRDALDSGTEADAVIISLPDRLHHQAALAALEKGYHILLEKPIGCSWKECEEIRDAQKRSRRLVLTGYVLHFSAYYKTLRDVIASGAIGELTSIHHLVAVGYGKASHAFCRGNWGREEDGTTMLVQKCTHDFDLIDWWTGTRRARRVSSFGSLVHWRPENAPAGSAARCIDCPPSVRAACPFDAVRLYRDESALRYHFADRSDAAMDAVVASSPYGRCVYRCGNDAVDHQTVLMEYDGGLTISLEMESYSKTRRRITHFYGTRGEIIADGEDSIDVRPFVGENRIVAPDLGCGGAHGGGDREIMTQFVRLIRSASQDRYPKMMEWTLESHRLAFLAEESRRSGKTMDAVTGRPA